MNWDKNVSPVGWYVGSYLLRFVELDRVGNDGPETRFLTWENTVLVKAATLDEAFDKVVRIGQGFTKPYKNALGVDVQWIFEGVTELLPVYDEIQDGAEIMWSEARSKLKNIRKRVRAKATLRE